MTLFEPFRSAVRVVFRSGALGFHHDFGASVIYSSALLYFFIPFVPGNVLVGGLGAVLAYLR